MADEVFRRLEEDGFAIVPDVLPPELLEQARAALQRGVELAQAAGRGHDAQIDPNPANIRVYNLPALDPVFIELLRWPAAVELLHAVLGPDYLVSNFTANIALPGSGAMNVHSDQALVIPPPWLQPWAMNIIWCLDDVDAENGATRYVPGSHRWRSFDDVPADAAERLVPFEAKAGSVIAMEGRVWHTSGANISKDRRRRMMFAYYSMDFIRPQMNWEAILPPPVKDRLDEEERRLFALGPKANTRIGGRLVSLAAG